MNNSNILYLMVAIASLVLVGLGTHAQTQEENVVDDVCLACICDASSGCNVTKICNGDVCGLFRITWFYWADSGKLTVGEDTEDSPMAFQNCANDPFCAAETVQNYMAKFRQDCNQDGKIDCLDYAAIHRLGGYGCPGQIFGPYAATLNQCLNSYSYDLVNSGEIVPPTMQNNEPTPDSTAPQQAPQSTEAEQVPVGSVSTENTNIEPAMVAIGNVSVEAEDISDNSNPLSRDVSGELPPLTLLEHLRPTMNTTTDQVTATISNGGATVEDFPEVRNNTSLEVTTELPPLTLLELLRPKMNTTTVSSIQSDIDMILGDRTDFRSENMPDIVSPSISPNYDSVVSFEDEKMAPTTSTTEATNAIESTQSTRRIITTNQDRIFNIIERIEKSKNDHTDRDLKFKDRFLEAFLNKNRIEEERNNILKEIAKNNQQNVQTDGQQLERRRIESSQENFLSKLERMEKSENEHKEQQLRFQERFLEAFLRKNRIEEERNKVLREVAKNNKPSGDIAPNYFLL
ncbi:uncharacterized protein LOC129918502 [Episyrphus balteatus]|uniref:uncharacterized protein LOC129918502 n=1 Tax=Episyrphus balteatus TaxID=286459 RepID=UPI0024865E18|nr:uncharacterized protein LOC129918502 [Episyrphus balteatus]